MRRFTGKPVSQTTGLYYEYQGWYDPSIGRLISQDPIRGGLETPQSLNPYVYAQNSPTTITDPSGLYVLAPHPWAHNSGCDLNWNSVSDYLASYWHSISTAQCWGFGPGGTVTGAYGGNTVGAGPAGAGIAGIITVIWVIDNWDSISNTWRTPPPDPGGSGHGSNGGSGTGGITTSGFTGGIGPVITVPGSEGLSGGLGSWPSDVVRAGLESSNFPTNVRGEQMRGPFTGKGGVLKACVGPGLFGTGLGIWIASQPSKNPNQNDYADVGAPFAFGLLFYFGCVAFGNWASSVPH